MASAILQFDLAGSTLGRLSIPLDFTPRAPKVQKIGFARLRSHSVLDFTTSGACEMGVQSHAFSILLFWSNK